MLFITFSDKPITDTPLGKSCASLGIELTVLGLEKPWISNGYKLYLLHQFLQSQVQDEIALILDAFDVSLLAEEKEILASFKQFDCDILFSAEANFYFNNRAKHNDYRKNYPISKYPYRFLNSGSYIGKVQHVITYLKFACEGAGLDISNESEFKPLKSDQYVLSKQFVDQQQIPDYPLLVMLDSKQELFGCTGGRMSAWQFPLISNKHAYYFFRTERFILRRLKITSVQYKSWDYQFNKSGFFSNLITKTQPLIFHIPGSKMDFYLRDNYLKNASVPANIKLLNWLIFPISLMAYLISLIQVVTRSYKVLTIPPYIVII